jgi:hypothetical protein
VIAGDVTLGAADDHYRLTAVLGPTEVGGGGELVRDRDPGGLELSADGVAAPAPILQRV